MNTRPNDPVLIGISLRPVWIPGLERAVDLLRERHPGMPDGELLERLMVTGICGVLDFYAPTVEEAPFGQVGQQVVAVIA